MKSNKALELMVVALVALYANLGFAAGDNNSTAGTPGAAGAPVTVETKGEVNQCEDTAAYRAQALALEQCKTDLGNCKTDKQTLIDGIAKLTDECYGTLPDAAKKLAPRTQKATTPPPPPPKPACPPVDLKFPGDDGGVSVKRDPVLMKKNGQDVLVCVATYASLVSLHDHLRKIDQENCDVTQTRNVIGGPDAEMLKLYTENHSYQYSDEECGELKAYLHGVSKFKFDLENAKMANGEPAPFSVTNWLIVWGRLQQAEERWSRTCRWEDGKWVSCPPPPVLPTVSRDDFKLGFGAVAQYHWRPVGPDSFVPKLQLILASYLPDSRLGARAHLDAGFSLNGDRNRYAFGGGFGLMVDLSSDEDGSINLHFGPEAGAEPTLGLNDVSYLAFGVGADFFLTEAFGLTVGVMGGGNTFERYDDKVRLGYRSSWKPFGALEAGLILLF